MNSQVRPSETAKVVRSWPTVTPTSAACAGVAFVARRRDRAQQREGLEVDPDELDPRLPAGGDVTVDQVAVREHEEDAAADLAFLVRRLAQHLVVEDGLVDRDREGFLRAELDRVRELLRVLDARDLQGADADPVRRDAEAHTALRKLVQLEELLQRLGQELGLAELAVRDDARVERPARELEHFGVAVVRDRRGRELRGADLQADEALRVLAAPARPRCRARDRERPGRRALDLLDLLRLRRVVQLEVRRVLRLAPEREVALVERHARFAVGLLDLLLLFLLGLRLGLVGKRRQLGGGDGRVNDDGRGRRRRQVQVQARQRRRSAVPQRVRAPQRGRPAARQPVRARARRPRAATRSAGRRTGRPSRARGRGPRRGRPARPARGRARRAARPRRARARSAERARPLRAHRARASAPRPRACPRRARPSAASCGRTRAPSSRSRSARACRPARRLRRPRGPPCPSASSCRRRGRTA